MRSALAGGPLDLVIADFAVPGFGALAAVSVLKETGLDIPFIVVSGTMSDEMAVRAMKAGAHDYVMKDNLVRLPLAVERELHEAEERRGRRLAEESVSVAQQLADERQTNLTRLGQLLDISARVLGEADAQGLLDQVVEGAGDLIGASVIVARQESRGSGEIVVARGSQGLDAETRLLERQIPALSDRLSAETPLQALVQDGTTGTAHEDPLPPEATIAAGLRDGSGALTGTIVAWGKLGGFSNSDRNLLGQLALLASLGLQHVEAHAQTSQVAAELEAVFESLGRGVLVWNAKGELVRANPAASTLAEDLGLPDLEGDAGITEPRERRSLSGLSTLFAPYRDLALAGESKRGALLRLSDSGLGERFLLYSSSPVVQDGEVLGAVAVVSDVTEREKLLEERLEAEKLAQTLNQINLSISCTFDRRSILTAAMDKAARSMACEAGSIFMRRDDRWHVYSLGESVLPRSEIGYPMEAIPHAGAVVESQRPALFDAHAYRSAGGLIPFPGLDELLTGPTILIVPVVSRGRVAWLCTFRRRVPEPFTRAQLEFAEKLGAAVSLALENVRAWEAEHRIATTLQEALLAVPAEIEGVEFAQVYRGASEEARVGGDFHDVFRLADGRVGVTIGDVSGKGIDAAITASLTRNTIQAYAYREVSPADVLAATNEVLLQATSRRAFVTAFFAILDPSTGAFRYCRAGHPPALVRTLEGEVLRLEVGSPVLGMFPDPPYTDGCGVLREGDLLLLYTDGVLEARQDGKFFGEDALSEVVAASQITDSKRLVSEVFSELLEFTQGELVDDVALLGISLRTSPQTGVARMTPEVVPSQLSRPSEVAFPYRYSFLLQDSDTEELGRFVEDLLAWRPLGQPKGEALKSAVRHAFGILQSLGCADHLTVAGKSDERHLVVEMGNGHDLRSAALSREGGLLGINLQVATIVSLVDEFQMGKANDGCSLIRLSMRLPE